MNHHADHARGDGDEGALAADLAGPGVRCELGHHRRPGGVSVCPRHLEAAQTRQVGGWTDERPDNNALPVADNRQLRDVATSPRVTVGGIDRALADEDDEVG